MWGEKCPSMLQGLGIEQAHPRREPLWLSERDLLDGLLNINTPRLTGWSYLSSVCPPPRSYIPVWVWQDLGHTSQLLFPPCLPHPRLVESGLSIELFTIVSLLAEPDFARQALDGTPVSALPRLDPAFATSSPFASPFSPSPSLGPRLVGETVTFLGRPTSTRENRYVSECSLLHVPDRNRPVPACLWMNGVQWPSVYLSVRLLFCPRAVV
jgi:hypothetical protein